MKRLLLIIVFLCYNLTLLSQNQAANWYFGFGAGMQFNLSANTVTPVTGGSLFTNEGCASISNNFGDLLFYTDGLTVFNRNHNIMPNGVGLFGDPSSTQSAIIVPKPNDDSIYYIFTVDNSFDGNNYGLNYSIVDMTLDGGLGDVISLNTNLLPICSEKISAVLKDCVTKSIWVITFATVTGASGSFNTYHAFEVSDSGVSNSSITSTFNVAINEARGYLKLSPDGTKLASANMGQGLYLYDFDVETGRVTNQQSLSINTQSSSAYGLEFSPNSQFLYVHSSNDQNSTSIPAHQSTLSQFNLNSGNISSSRVTLDQRQLYRGGLQLGPDGKIYRALSASYSQGLPFLGVINSPNMQGVGSNYQHNAISLSPNSSGQGLPPFIQSIFNTQVDIIQNNVSTTNLPLCTGDTYTLRAENIPGASYSWTRNGSPLPENDFDLVVIEEGHYEVFIDLNDGDCDIEGQAFVNYYDNPTAENLGEITICDFTTTTSFNLSSLDQSVLGTQNPTEFIVKYFTSLDAANNARNQITGTFNNDSNPQELFARVENISNPNCYVTTSFMFKVYLLPVISNLTEYITCDTDFDGNSRDGFTTVDLSEINSEILENQEGDMFTITYHNSQDNAESRRNSLPTNYTNTTPYSEEIFVRIENNAHTECYITDSFVLTVNDAPEAFATTLIQCDEDGTADGITNFNFDQVTDDITGGASNRQINYYLSRSDANNDLDAIDGSDFRNSSNPQNVYAKVTNTSTGCSNIAILTLEVSMTSSNEATLEACDDDGNEDGFYNFNLSDADADVLSGLPSNLDLEYYESYEDALLEQNPLGSNYINTNPYSQIIYARVENANACYGISEIQLTIFRLPNIEIEDETIYCLNFFPEPIIITSGLLDGSPSNYSYEWSTGENTSEIMVNTPGVYTVRVSNANGCFKDRSVTVNASNIATITSIDVTDASQNNSITIHVTGEGTYEYAIDNINGLYQLSNTFQNIRPGLHTIYVRDQNNCGISEKLVSVIGFPKYFTPNNDGFHDYWQVSGISEQFQPNTSILIFDRFGKLLKTLNPLSNGWDGTFNGQLMPTSDYWFSVTLEDGRTFKSHFTLKR